MARALALYSGGLDSILAVLVILRQGVEVTALSFLTRIGCGISDRSPARGALTATAERFGFTLRLIDLSEKFMAIVRNPAHGYGRNMNPCLDCKILMLREARELLEREGFDFIITGEVLYQRPMSQRRDTFPVIEREAGLKGLILRPLSARLLNPTIPEERGLVRRELLYGFSGRSRKPQMALAKELGLTDYPQPAGGCLLTDPIYSHRLREFLIHNPEPTSRDLSLLRLGRHFRVSGDCTIIVGRDEAENAAIQEIAAENDTLFFVPEYGSPVTLLRGDCTDEAVRLAASLCARYSDAKGLPAVDVNVLRNSQTLTIRVEPSSESTSARYRVQPP